MPDGLHPIVTGLIIVVKIGPWVGPFRRLLMYEGMPSHLMAVDVIALQDSVALEATPCECFGSGCKSHSALYDAGACAGLAE